jgi:hypothetical protein
MKIIKKFSDYYDSALAYGVDNTIMYKREEKEVEFTTGSRNKYSSMKQNCPNYVSFPSELKNVICETEDFLIFESWRAKKEVYLEKNKKTAQIKINYLIFCGEVIPYVCFTFSKNYESVNVFAYGYEKLLSELSKYTSQKYMDSFFNSESDYMSKKTIGQKIEEMFVYFKGKDYSSIHHHFECPVLLISGCKLIQNPILKDIDFAKHSDPFATYQALEQYISGVLGGSSPKMIECSDKVKLEAHGFDNKTSFRKGKESKK